MVKNGSIHIKPQNGKIMVIPKEQYERITAEMSQMKMAQGGDVRSMIDDEMRMRKVCKAHNCSIDQYRQAKKTYGDGGNIAKENRDMVANNNKQIAHHTKELEKALGDGKSVPAWVVAKVNRSASDLSDVTHYLDGSEEKMAKGGIAGNHYRITWGLGYYEDYKTLNEALRKKKEFVDNPPAWARLPKDTPTIYRFVNGEIDYTETYAKGGIIHYFQDKDSHRMGRPNSIDKDLLNKVGYESFKDDFVGNFGWMTPYKKLADGYLFKLDSFDQYLVKDIKLKSGERIFRYFNEMSAIGGIVPIIKINLEKGLLYFTPMKEFGDDSIEFETKGVKAEWVNLIEDKMAKGGGVGNDYMKRWDVITEQVRFAFAKVLGLDRAMNLLDRSYAMSPYKLVERAVYSDLLLISEIDNILINSAIQEARYSNEMEEIGSSDTTYLLKGMLDGAGLQTAFINHRLERVDANGNAMQLKNDLPSTTMFAKGGVIGDMVNIQDKKSLYNGKSGVIVGEDGQDWIVETPQGRGFVKKSKVEVIKSDDKFDEFAKGGEVKKHVDLIEHYEQMPPKIAKIFDKYWNKYGEDMDYGIIAKMHDEVYKQGYTFESGLDASIYGLRPIGVKLNQLEGYEDVDESTDDEPFAVGGMTGLGDLANSYDMEAVMTDGQKLANNYKSPMYLMKRPNGEYVVVPKGEEMDEMEHHNSYFVELIRPRYDVGGNIPSWLFIGTYPNAYIYADNRIETRGEYHRIGAVYFNPLSYVIKDNSPKYKEVHDMIINEYEMMKGKESVQISSTGQTARIGKNPLGYAEGGTTQKEYIAKKVGKVMHEFKEGELHSGSGAKVTDRKQAIAIGLSEGRKGWKHRRKK